MGFHRIEEACVLKPTKHFHHRSGAVLYGIMLVPGDIIDENDRCPNPSGEWGPPLRIMIGQRVMECSELYMVRPLPEPLAEESPRR
ncbi:MAG: hypothetical protein WAN50_02970 [Minisyncoccia bacterium]